TRTLILMRHAAAAGAARDEERPLTAGGRLAAAEAGEWIRSTLPRVDTVLCSIAVRTRQTLAALAIDAPADYLDELYNGGVDDIGQQIGLVPDACTTVLVVGHAPGIPATAHRLATFEGAQTPLIDELRYFSAGALAVLRTAARWNELVNTGGELITVRHPDR
ncbi:MAG: histidine phosphatase family protein, partial [Nakamurella sp.]